MKAWPVLIALLAAGCQSQAPDAKPTQDPPKQEKPAPEAAPKTEIKVEKPKPEEGNPNRIYQLKDLRVVKVKAPNGDISLWVMDTEGKEQEGMMWLTEKDVKDDQGMVFVFPEAKDRAFWMQNTILPLDIIFCDSKGKVLNIGDGRPKDETTVPSTGAAQYVVELKKGNAQKFGIKPGTILGLELSLKM